MVVDIFVDYYEILHVQPSAPAAVIKASYRAMLQKLNHHPDRGGDVAFAQLLNQAAATLCNSQARAHYDQLREQQLAARHKQQTPGNAAGGAPGGSPDKDRKQPSGDNQQDSADTSGSSQNTGIYQQSEPTNTKRSQLSGKAQCPFCLTPYPLSYPENQATREYANTARCQVCNAARTPISQLPQSSSHELRRMHRHNHETPAGIWTTWPATSPVACVLKDFSPAGCAVEYPHLLANAEVVMLDTDLFNAVCKVRYCHNSDTKNYTIGLEFITLDMLARPGTLLKANA